MHSNYQNRPNRARGANPKQVMEPVLAENTDETDKIEPTTAEETVVTQVKPTVVEGKTQAPKIEKPIIGVVANCGMLNVREHPDSTATILTTIPAGYKVVINQDQSTNQFYKISNAAGIEGYCMRRYIEIDGQ